MSALVGTALVDALLSGARTPSRYRKTARHIQTAGEWTAFVAALRAAAVSDEVKTEIETWTRRYVTDVTVEG